MASFATVPKTMRTICISSPNGPWTLQTVPTPSPEPTQVLVKISACGICGTDIWLTQSKLSFAPFPLPIGHEAIGTIISHGTSVSPSTVSSLPIGTRVGICLLQRGCHSASCSFCVLYPGCTDLKAATNCANPILTGFNTPHGAQSQYICVDADGVVPIPLGKGNGEVSDEFFAPMICAGYSAWCGLLRGEPKPGEVVAVVGVGGIGHLAVMMSVGVGGYRTIVVCSDEEKREWVKGLAPTVEVVKNGEELEEAGGADVLLACGSDNSKVEDAMQAMKPGGRVVLMGICFGDAVEGEEVGVEEKGPKGLVIHNLRFLFNGLQVRGSSHNGKEYLVQALKMVADGKVRPVVEVFGVEKIEKAVQRAMGGKAMGRVVVKWD